MNIDFTKVVAALKKVNYRGYFTLEATQYLSAFTADTVLTGLQDLAHAARRLADMFEEA